MAPPSSTLLARLGVDLDSVCGAGAYAAVPGRHREPTGVEARADRLSEAGPTETDYQGRRPLAGTGWCAAHIDDDVVIDVPDSQVHRQVVRKRAGVAALPVDPGGSPSLRRGDRARPGQPERRPRTARPCPCAQWGLSDLVVDHRSCRFSRRRCVGELEVTVAMRHTGI